MTDVTAPDAIINDEMRAAQGRVLSSRSSYPISASDIRKWALAVYYPEAPPARFIGAGAAGARRPWSRPRSSIPSPGRSPPPMQFMVNGVHRVSPKPLTLPTGPGSASRSKSGGR